MKSPLKYILGAVLTGLSSIGLCQNAGIRLSTYPAVSVADGRSTITVTAELRDNEGRTLPDGAQVIFATTLGSFRDTVVTTAGGSARGILVAGGLPGTAKITVSAPAYSAVSTIDFEFLSNRSLLSGANEYVEIVSPGYLTMNFEKKILGAAEPNRGAHVRYRDISVDADDIQVDAQTAELRARKAHLKFGKIDQDFEELFLKLPSRSGLGTTSFIAPVTTIIPDGRYFRFHTETKERFGFVEIRSTGIKPSPMAAAAGQFDFVDISNAETLISAKKAVVFPRKEVQFQKAEILVDGQKAMKFPLFEVNLYGGTPILTEQIVNLNDSKVSINYPEYVLLKPGLSSLFRFRTGQSYGRGISATGGAFLDWEMNWNRGDQMDGGLTISGLARRDYDISLHQAFHPDDRTNSYIQLETPAFGSVFGAMGFTRQFTGYQFNMNANSSRSLQGIPFNSQQASMSLEKDPIKLGKLPIQTYIGLTATESATDTTSFTTSQNGVGLRIRNQMLPRSLDKRTLVNASLTFSKLAGEGQPGGIGVQGSAYIARQLSASASTQMIYDYLADGYSSSLLGHHRLTLMGNYAAARTSVNLMTMRTLDADSFNYQADLNYRVSSIWRLAYRHTFNRFYGASFLDYNAMLTYRYGNRDIGLTWSNITHKLGIQLLGASLN